MRSIELKKNQKKNQKKSQIILFFDNLTLFEAHMKLDMARDIKMPAADSGGAGS